MKFKKKTVLTFAMLGLGIWSSQAQTGIGTNTPDKSSQLDVTSPIRGLLMPRLPLVKTTDTTPIFGPPATSLLVYNTAAVNDLVPGFYYWDSAKWVKITTGADSGAGQSLGYKKVIADYTVLPEDYAIVASELTGDITITLPDAAGVNKGRVLVINQLNGTTAEGTEITVKFSIPVVYSDAVSASELLAPVYSSTGGSLKITLQSDGTNWHAISSL